MVAHACNASSLEAEEEGWHGASLAYVVRPYLQTNNIFKYSPQHGLDTYTHAHNAHIYVCKVNLYVNYILILYNLIVFTCQETYQVIK